MTILLFYELRDRKTRIEKCKAQLYHTTYYYKYYELYLVYQWYKMIHYSINSSIRLSLRLSLMNDTDKWWMWREFNTYNILSRSIHQSEKNQIYLPDKQMIFHFKYSQLIYWYQSHNTFNLHKYTQINVDHLHSLIMLISLILDSHQLRMLFARTWWE